MRLRAHPRARQLWRKPHGPRRAGQVLSRRVLTWLLSQAVLKARRETAFRTNLKKISSHFCCFPSYLLKLHTNEQNLRSSSSHVCIFKKWEPIFGVEAVPLQWAGEHLCTTLTRARAPSGFRAPKRNRRRGGEAGRMVCTCGAQGDHPGEGSVKESCSGGRGCPVSSLAGRC